MRMVFTFDENSPDELAAYRFYAKLGKRKKRELILQIGLFLNRYLEAGFSPKEMMTILHLLLIGKLPSSLSVPLSPSPDLKAEMKETRHRKKRQTDKRMSQSSPSPLPSQPPPITPDRQANIPLPSAPERQGNREGDGERYGKMPEKESVPEPQVIRQQSPERNAGIPEPTTASVERPKEERKAIQSASIIQKEVDPEMEEVRRLLREQAKQYGAFVFGPNGMEEFDPTDPNSYDDERRS